MKAFRYLSSFTSEQSVGWYKSNFGPDIEVCLINGRYQINAGSVNYSFGPLHDAFRRYFHIDPPESGTHNPVLILGFGGGSVANILRKELNLPNPITGVEIDEMIIKAGFEHFDTDKLRDLNLIIDDAYDYVFNCKLSYKLIVVDIYIDDQVPEKFETEEFIAQVSRCLQSGGKLVFNKLIDDLDGESDVKKLEDIFSVFLSEVKTYRIPINKKSPNIMITGIKQ
ncbi:MAG: hypothetical protein K0B15_05085 [Lentimicrobium sp.]|nr:hypothetical protein [Lentimicrobium sp.]